MAIYTKDQISRYLAYIGFDAQLAKPPSLSHLEQLVSKHIAAVPFESLSLHYSKSHKLSLDPDDLFEKVVGYGRGGYCMENNTLFGVMLSSLGYTVMHVGARVSDATAGRPGGGFNGLNHMVNLVAIDGLRHLVDVGFGGSSPCRPIPLIDGHELRGITPQRLRLDSKTLPQHTDRSQKVWVYSHRDKDDAPWTEGYAFTEMEFFAADFEVMNLATSTLRQSFFLQSVVCVKVLLGGDGEPEGQLVLLNGNLTRKLRGQTQVLAQLKSEDERAAALSEYFGISLSPEQRKGIRNLPSELRG